MKILAILLTLILTLTACTQNKQPQTALETLPQTSAESQELQIQSPQPSGEKTLPVQTVLNYDTIYGMWFTYMDYTETLAGKTREEFTEIMTARFKNAQNLGVNTVYVQVRAFCDAYYESRLFEKAYKNDFDPLEIMLEIAHSLNLSFHAWINPLRGQTYKNIESLDEFFVEIDGRFFLNPNFSEVREYVADGVREIITNYDVDGVQIDDYFYPDYDFPETADEKRANIDELVKAIYSAVKEKNPQILFDIAPQGNIENNKNVQFADVEKWLTESGYCDVIIPQIYYGFENQVCPFAETVEKWANLAQKTKLSVGICTYKIGVIDTFAGTGKNEWIDNEKVIEEQIQFLQEKNIGISVYSYSSTFATEPPLPTVYDINLN